MICKKCKKEIPEGSSYCNWCGAPQKRDQKKKLYQRPDGLFEKSMTINGKRVVFRGRTEKEINQKMLEYQEQKERGELFSVIAEQWREEHFETLSPNTLKGYTPACRRAIEFFGDYSIKDIAPADVKKYLASFPKTWAQKTYRNHMLVLNQIFNYAAANGEIETNPAEYVQIPKGLKKTYRRAPTPEEIEGIKKGLSLSFGLFPFFLLYTGCRLGEALAIQYKDIDRKAGKIHITKSVYFTHNQPGIKQPKTEKGIRDVVLLDVLADVLPKGKPNQYLFGGNQPFTKSEFDSRLKRYKQEAGLPEITPHMLRHGYATILHEAGIDPKDAQVLLGHAQLSTTMDIYTHITEKVAAESAEKLNTYTQNTQ